jgi:ankyrin repeat protein
VTDGSSVANVQDVEGRTVLHLAAQEDRLDCLKLLISLDSKIDVNIKDKVMSSSVCGIQISLTQVPAE